MWGVTLTTFGILGLHNISGTVEARNFKFDVEMEDIEYKRKNAKLGQKWSCGRQVIDFGILGPPNIAGTNEARNFKFGRELYGSDY